MTAGDLWPAPAAPAPPAALDATVRLPGSKSITNRALLLAAIADAPSTVWHPLRARDTELMAAGLRSLGVDIVDIVDIVDAADAAGTPVAWRVTPQPLHGGVVEVGNAGTVMRFVPPVAALAAGTVSFHGDARASERPLTEVLDALRAMGVAVDGDRVPFTLHGTGRVTGGRVVIDASMSSQFVSALLLAGARYDHGVEVVHQGSPVPSQPHIDMTVTMLREAGVVVDTSVPDRWAVAAGPVVGRDVHVEPDLSNAAPFLAAGMVTGGRVRVLGWPRVTTQAGDALRDLFARMGGTCAFDGDDLVLTGPARGTLTGLEADLHDVGELAPVLAAVCALATTPSELRGIAHLRLHETDRLAALAAELGALGATVVELDDGLRIEPAALHGAVFHTYDDHRLATAAAVLGLVVPGVLVENVSTTNKTLPGFVGLWQQVVAPAGAAPGRSTAPEVPS
jgi:3-phosphoshikimate 1-carboxyvinyltransferase